MSLTISRRKLGAAGLALAALAAAVAACDSASAGFSLPTGTSTSTIYWAIPKQYVPYASTPAFSTTFHGTLAGKSLSGTLTGPAAAAALKGNCIIGDPGITITGSVGGLPISIAETCLAPTPIGAATSPQGESMYTGHIGGIAVHGTEGSGIAGPGASVNNSIDSYAIVTGTIGTEKVRVEFPIPGFWNGNTTLTNFPNIQGETVTTVATLTVTQE